MSTYFQTKPATKFMQGNIRTIVFDNADPIPRVATPAPAEVHPADEHMQDWEGWSTKNTVFDNEVNELIWLAYIRKQDTGNIISKYHTYMAHLIDIWTDMKREDLLWEKVTFGHPQNMCAICTTWHQFGWYG